MILTKMKVNRRWAGFIGTGEVWSMANSLQSLVSPVSETESPLSKQPLLLQRALSIQLFLFTSLLFTSFSSTQQKKPKSFI